MKEIWRDIYFKDKGLIWDYRGQYQVSNKGNVRSLNYNQQINLKDLVLVLVIFQMLAEVNIVDVMSIKDTVGII